MAYTAHLSPPRQGPRSASYLYAVFGYAIDWSKRWSKLEVPQLVGLGLFALYVINYVSSGDPWVPVLDSANLAFHEFGHPMFAPFGDTMGWLGGTLGQLMFPVIGIGIFVYRKHTASLAMCLLWFFQNFFNIARYVADARDQALPLVGGGEHDWTYLLTKWDVLAKEMIIAENLRRFAWGGFIATGAWLAWRFYRQRIEARMDAAEEQAQRAAKPLMPYARPAYVARTPHAAASYQPPAHGVPARQPSVAIGTPAPSPATPAVIVTKPVAVTRDAPAAPDLFPDLPPLPAPKSAGRADAPLTIPPVEIKSKL